MVTNDPVDIKKIEQAIEALPPMSRAAQEALSQLKSSETMPRDLEPILEQDPALLADVLRIANSAFYNTRARTIRQALVRLGLSEIKRILLTAAVLPTLNPEVPGYDLDSGSLADYSVVVASLAQQLAASHGVGEEAYTAGMLHDLGKVISGPLLRDRMTEIEAVLANGTSDFPSAERQVLGMDHAEIGARIAELWRFPPEIVEVIRFHHDPSQTTATPILLAVHVGSVLTNMLGIGLGTDGLLYMLDPEAQKLFDLDEDHTTMLILETAEIWDELRAGPSEPE